MPFSNYHSSRQKDPSGYDRIRIGKNKGGNGIDFVYGFKKGGGSEIISVRFNKKQFSPKQAKAWLKKHSMGSSKFEPASEAMTIIIGEAEYPYEKIRDLIYVAMQAKFPGSDGYGCRYWIERTWADKILCHKSYSAKEEDHNLCLIPYTLMEPEGEGSPEVELGEPIPVQIQAVPKDGGTPAIIDEGIHNEEEELIDEAGKRNAKKDAKSMNTIMKMMMDMMDDDDIDEEVMGKWKERYDKKTKKPMKKEAQEPTDEQGDNEKQVAEWATMEGETVTEEFAVVLGEAKLSEDKLIIKNSVILSRTSVNGRDYPDDVQEAAVPLFEGAKAFIDHPEPDKMHLPRNARDLLGEHRNVHFANGKTYSDIHLLNNDVVRGVILPIIEQKPHLCGNSVVVRINQKFEKETGRYRVEKILAARSVDIVTEPATTKGIFESKESQNFGMEDSMDWKDVTLEALKKERPELVEEILSSAKEKEKVATLEAKVTELDTAVKERDTKLAAFEVENAKRAHESLVSRIVSEAKLPDKVKYEEKEGKRIIKPIFEGVLMRCQGEEEMKAVVADWEKTYSVQQPVSEGKEILGSTNKNIDTAVDAILGIAA